MSSKPRVAALARTTKYLADHPGKTLHQVRKNLSRYAITTAEIRAAADKAGYAFPEKGSAATAKPLDVAGGIRISGQRVMPRKPADSAKVHIRRLPKGRAFVLEDLANRLALSQETLKRHAKALGCLLFIEVAPDDWQQVVLNPETAKNYANEI